MDAEELPRNVSRRQNALDDKEEALFYSVESLGNDHDDHLVLY